VILPKVDLGGKTMLAALNELIDRKRGIGFAFTFEQARTDPDDDTSDESDDADSTTLTVNVFSVFDEAVAFPDSSERVAANPNVVSIDVSTLTQPENVVFNLDTIDRYGKIRVVGERVVACFTVCKQDDTLDKAWSRPSKPPTLPSAPAGRSRTTTSGTPISITTFSHTS
jgi:hypothetical protein